MAIDAKHPAYIARFPDWEQLAHCYAGERAIKERREKYLPPTEGMRIDGMNEGQDGKNAYDAYLARAVFPDYVRQGVEAMVGIMHREPARIEVPPELEPLLDSLGANGESIQMLLRRLNEWQLLYGRAGLLVINWDDGLRIQGKQVLEFVTLDESDYERTGSFEWEFKNRFRICAMSSTGVYQVAKVEGADPDVTQADWVTPSIGGRTLDRIPFIFVNTKDLVSSPDDPPLLGLSNTCLAIYRGEADYRQSLHMQGQETFVIIGADDDKKTRLGAGARIELPRDGDAKFVGVSADGLAAMKDAINDDKRLAEELTSRLFDATGTTYQSGEALRIRVSAKTATLRTIALTGAEALKQALIIVAEWVGADPSKIVVEPNTDFADTSAASRTALELTQAKILGFPISNRSLHRFAVQHGLTELTFEEEKEAIEEDAPALGANQQGIGGITGGILGRATGGSRVPRGVEDAPSDGGDE